MCAMNIKPFILLFAGLVSAHSVSAQEAGKIYRSEVLPYNLRQDADTRNSSNSEHAIIYSPKAVAMEGSSVAMGQSIDIPYVWTDGNVYLHLENVGTAYTLLVNGKKVAEVEDSITPSEFALTPYIREGANEVVVIMRKSRTPQLNFQAPVREAFDNSYLYYQNKRSIRDYEIALIPDTLGRNFAMLDLKIVAQNAYNYDETVTVGYDIYSPAGKLQEFNITDITLRGRSTDTVRFTPFIYNTAAFKWQPGVKDAPFYKVMLFTRRKGAYKEYMPLKVGFGKTEFKDGRLMRWGKELQLKKKVYNSAKDAKTTLTELRAIKRQGYNTITPDYPQPVWFYEQCDRLGLYVIDKANIHCPDRRDDRTVGGTPSNDPSLAGEYLERVKSMYYRSRNFTCVVAFSLGGQSGNGYNMYKAYQWLKSVEKHRPVICEDAAGEWNTDL